MKGKFRRSFARFSFAKQPDKMDCGPACLKMVARFYGRNYSFQTLRNFGQISKDGISLLGISDAAEKIGFRTIGAKLDLEDL
jgi:ATP-binding cassette subfamily B protein